MADWRRGTRIAAPEVPSGEIVVRAPEDIARAVPGNPLARMLPVVLMVAAGGMMLLYFTSGTGGSRNPASLLFPAMMIVSTLGMVAHGGRGGTRTAEVDQNRRDYLRYLSQLRSRVTDEAARQRYSLSWQHPDPAALWTLAGTGRMWASRATDSDFCHVRVGLGTQRSAVLIMPPDVGPAYVLEPVGAAALRAFVRTHSAVDEVPIAIALTRFRRVTVDGDSAIARNLMRALVCQLVSLHGPDQVSVRAHIGGVSMEWDWLKWLPHVRADAAVHTVVVADTDSPGVGVDESVAGTGDVTVLELGAGCLGEHEPHCLHLEVAADAVSIVGEAREVIARPDAMTILQADLCARRIARHHVASERVAAIPPGRQWAGLVGIGDLSSIDPDLVWSDRAPRDRLRVPVGMSAGGSPVFLDLKEAAEQGGGPHGLCVGATGSGKPVPELWHNREMVTRAAVYCRISRDKTGAGLGVERQEQDSRALAERLGWDVSKVYVDNDLSAFSGKRRPQYRALLADIKAGQVSGVLAWHPDRLHRSPTELEEYVELSERHKVTTHTVQAGQWDLSTPAGRLNARVVGSFSRYESEHRSARVKRASQQRAVSGGWSGGRRCYGWEPDGMTIRDPEAAELRKAAEAVVSGVSLRSIVADLNARSVPTTNGTRPWDSVTLRSALTSPRNAGLSSYRGEIVGEADWPAIIAADVWHAVHRILTDPSRRTNGHVGGTVKWLGSGIYRCGVCKSRDVRVGVVEGRKRYRCRNRVKGDPATHVGRDARRLDHYIEMVLVERLSDTAVLDRLTPQRPDVDAVVLRDELVKSRSRLSEAAELYATGGITAAQLTTITASTRTRIESIEGELASGVADSPLVVFRTADDVSRVWYGPGGADGDRSGGLPLGTRRQLLRLLADVTILPARPGRSATGTYFDPDCIHIDWKTEQE